RGDDHDGRVHRAHAGARPGRAGRGRPRRRHRVRRCRQVSCAGEVRVAGMDGIQGRTGPHVELQRGGSMTETHSEREGRTAADLEQETQEAQAAQASAGGAEGVAKVDDVEEAMRDVVDPELGINVVDLGLVYDIRVEPDNTAAIDMTLTSAACPLTDVIEDQTASVLKGSGKLVDDFRINWVWMPPWGPEKITEDGREQLRALGFTV